MPIKEALAWLRKTDPRSDATKAQSESAPPHRRQGCQTGIGAMLKTVYAIAAAAIVAACLVLSPSLTPQVAAGSPSPSGKSDRADARVLGTECSQRAWPYYEAACLRDTRDRLVQPHDVRFIALDNMPRPAGTSAVASR
jgi:hypothetical protein